MLYAGGEVQRKEIDREGKGRPDRLEQWGEGRLVRVELDEDADGRFELVNFYDPQGRLEKQEQDENGDGRADAFVTFDSATGKETRVLRDRDGDGKRRLVAHERRAGRARSASRRTRTRTASPTASSSSRAGSRCGSRRTATATASPRCAARSAPTAR